MKKEELFDILGDISEQYIKEARLTKKKNGTLMWLGWGAIAACIALLILGISMIGDFSPVEEDNTPTMESLFVENNGESETIQNNGESEIIQRNEENETLQNIGASEVTENNEDENRDYEPPAVGGGDFMFLRKYIDEVYNIQLASEVVGREACQEWVDNVFLKKSAEEQEGIPPIYQIIVDLGISKEDLIKKNNENDGIYLSDETIDALYQEDIEEVKKALMSPYSLYHEGEIYTFDELCADANLGVDIPAETLDAYFDYIKKVCEQEGMLKYMQETIDNVRKAYGLE